MDSAKEHEAPQGVKLTAVTLNHSYGPLQVFVPLPHDHRGRPILSMSVFDKIIRDHCVGKKPFGGR